MAKEIRIRKGLDIRLKGEAEKVFSRIGFQGDYALYPSDFRGVTPRLLVREGDQVKAGTPLFHSKRDERIVFMSPVSGEVVAVERAERRRIERVVVRCTSDNLEYEEHGAALPAALDRQAIIERMLTGGVWPFVRQRPFDIIASPDVTPRAIFISAFDTAPLAPDIDFAIKDDGESFQVGIDALAKLTDGKIHLCVNAKYPPNPAFSSARGVELHRVSGPHPAGNVGVQIHHIAPVRKGEVVWTINPLDVVVIGRLFHKGRYDARRIVALAGPPVAKPRYYTSMIGGPVSQLLEGQVEDVDKLRVISGNALSGTKVPASGNVHFYDTMVTVLREGNHHEFMGWAAPGFNKLSSTRMFPSFLMPGKRYDLDTNLHGGERAFVLSGQYERVVPMRIYPVHLIKAILAEDYDGMENLGIYEVAEEDFALCDFVCVSKIEAQSIIGQGIDLMLKELN